MLKLPNGSCGKENRCCGECVFVVYYLMHPSKTLIGNAGANVVNFLGFSTIVKTTFPRYPLIGIRDT